MATTLSSAAEPKKSKQFIVNVLWNWSAVVVNVFTALILSPFIIRRLGDDNYGLWALHGLARRILLDHRSRLPLRHHQVFGALSNARRIRTDQRDSNTRAVLFGVHWSGAGACKLFGAPLLAHAMHVQHPLFPQAW